MKEYRKIKNILARPYVKGEDLTGVSVSDRDDPETDMGMIAQDMENENDKWYINRNFFEENYESAQLHIKAKEDEIVKDLGISCTKKAKDNISDLVIFGNGDMFKLLSKASSQKQGWMKSTKVWDTGSGCVVQVTTQQRNPDGSYAVAEALTFVPNVRLAGEGENRYLSKIEKTK